MKAGAGEENKPYRLLLTWMANDVSLFGKLSGIIDEEDFPGDDYRTVAEALFTQYRETGMVNLASIVDSFTDVDKQRLAASILQTEFSVPLNKEEQEQALNEVVKRVKNDSIERELSTGGAKDAVRLSKLIQQKADLNKLYIRL